MKSTARTTKTSEAAADATDLPPARAARIEVMLPRIRLAIAPFRKAALFELAEKGFNSAFEQLVACLISIRPRDEETIPIADGFFARARTPAEVARLSVAEVNALLAH